MPVFRWSQGKVHEARPLAAVGTSSMRTSPWTHEPIVRHLHSATTGRGSASVEVATLAAATWPVPRTMLQSRLRPPSTLAAVTRSWAGLFHDRSAWVGVGAINFRRAEELVASLLT